MPSRVYQQLVAVVIVFVFGLVGMGWWYSPRGQIQQVRWELADLGKQGSYEYRKKAAIAFLKDGNLKQTSAIVNSITYSRYKAWILTTIAETYAT